MQLRPEVQRFAEAMEAKLQANDHKPGWKGDTPEALLIRLRQEALELHSAVDVHTNVLSEAADVANFAMMIADVCGELPASTGTVVSRDECPFHYCDNPPACHERCHHRW